MLHKSLNNADERLIRPIHLGGVYVEYCLRVVIKEGVNDVNDGWCIFTAGASAYLIVLKNALDLA